MKKRNRTKRIIAKTIFVFILVMAYSVVKDFVFLPVNNVMGIQQMQDSNLAQSTFDSYQKLKWTADVFLGSVVILIYSPEIKSLIKVFKQK
jgi:hypothetical protein